MKLAQRGARRRDAWGADAGSATVEAAFAVAALVTVAGLCVSGLVAITTQVRCTDAAREVARLVARGEADKAVAIARRIAPGSTVDFRREGGFVVARVSSDAPVLPGFNITAEAISADEGR